MSRAEALALAALTDGRVARWLFAFATYPNYQALYSLLWCREILDGVRPSFDAYRAPTQHPLWVAPCVPLAELGEGGDRVLLAI